MITKEELAAWLTYRRRRTLMISQEQLENWLTYHPPTAEQLVHYTAIRQAALSFAKVLVGHTPSSADQTAAVRKIREAVMTANAAIACWDGNPIP